MAASPRILPPKVISLIAEQLCPGPLSSSGGWENTNAPGSNVYSDSERRECRKTLVQLACCSRAISGLAFDVLWRHVDDFRHLLYPFNSYTRKTCMFHQHISEAEWQKFRGYALRVRELHLGEIGRVHSAVWVVLGCLSSQQPLLPLLESLKGFTVNFSSACYTMLFSPTLRHLELKVDTNVDDGILRFVLQAAKPALAAIDSLSLSDRNRGLSDRLPMVAFWELQQLRNLEVRHNATLTADRVRSLAAFHNLHKLRIRLEAMPVMPAVENPGFPSLRTLSITGQLQDISAFFSTTRPAHLEDLTIDVTGTSDTDSGHSYDPYGRPRSPQPASLDPIFAALTPTLRLLRVICARSLQFPDGKKLFEPLRPLHDLRVLSFLFHGEPVKLGDQDLRSFNDAWSQLVEFRITTPPQKSEAPVASHYHPHDRIMAIMPPDHVRPRPKQTLEHPTIQTLALFAQAHPRLHSLALPVVDTKVLPAHDAVPLGNRTLRQLSFGTLDRDASLVQCALALDKIFPELDVADAQDAAVSPLRSGDSRDAELRMLLFMLRAGRAGTSWTPHAPKAAAAADTAGEPAWRETWIDPHGNAPVVIHPRPSSESSSDVNSRAYTPPAGPIIF